jgi:hypothetical protein
VVLTLERNETLFPNVAKTPNQRAVAGALSQFPSDNPLFLAVLNQTADGARQAFDAPTIDTTSRTGKLVMGILALIAEFENDIRRERQMDGIAKARDRGVKFGRKPILVPDTICKVRKLRKSGETVPEIMRQTLLSKASVYRALAMPPTALG